MSTLLITKESPLQLLPKLAVALESSDAAIVLQQIHYWLNKCGKIVKDQSGLWIFNRLADWQQQFPWLSMWKLRGVMSHLRGMGVVIFKQLKIEKYNRTGWYTIDYEKLQKVLEPLQLSICDIFTRREEDSPHNEMRNAHTSVDTVENLSDSISSLEREPKKKENDDYWQEEEKPEDTIPQPEVKEHTVPPSNFGEDNFSAAPQQPRLKINRDRYAWEIAIDAPYPAFTQWWANVHYKPQGGHWETGAESHAYSEFYKNLAKTTNVLFPKFLKETNTIAENCNQLQNAEMKATLPSWFIASPEATEENVQQLMENLHLLVERGVEVALPQGTATSSCRQAISFEAAANTELKALPVFENLVLPVALSKNLQKEDAITTSFTSTNSVGNLEKGQVQDCSEQLGQNKTHDRAEPMNYLKGESSAPPQLVKEEIQMRIAHQKLQADRKRKLRLACQAEESPGFDFLFECWEDGDMELRQSVRKALQRFPDWAEITDEGELVEPNQAPWDKIAEEMEELE